MDCSTARELLHPYEDGALQPWERAELEGHLEGCGLCQRELEDLRRTLWLLGRLGPMSAPRGFADEVMARIATEEAPMRALSRRGERALGGGLLLAALLGLFLLFQTGEKLAQTAASQVQSAVQGALPVESPSPAEPGILLAEMEDRWVAFLESLTESPGTEGLGFILGACLLLMVGGVFLAHLIVTGATASRSVWLAGASNRTWGNWGVPPKG